MKSQFIGINNFCLLQIISEISSNFRVKSSTICNRLESSRNTILPLVKMVYGQGMTSEEVRISEDGDFLRECTECTGKRVTKFFTYKLSQL